MPPGDVVSVARPPRRTPGAAITGAPADGRAGPSPRPGRRGPTSSSH